jgi:hypothetical protein
MCLLSLVCVERSRVNELVRYRERKRDKKPQDHVKWETVLRTMSSGGDRSVDM